MEAERSTRPEKRRNDEEHDSQFEPCTDKTLNGDVIEDEEMECGSDVAETIQHGGERVSKKHSAEHWYCTNS